jgi:hypothetical protein
MFVLFRPQMAALLERRDEVIAGWEVRHPGSVIFEDRALEITSQISISVEDRIAQFRSVLDSGQAC